MGAFDAKTAALKGIAITIDNKYTTCSVNKTKLYPICCKRATIGETKSPGAPLQTVQKQWLSN